MSDKICDKIFLKESANYNKNTKQSWINIKNRISLRWLRCWRKFSLFCYRNFLKIHSLSFIVESNPDMSYFHQVHKKILKIGGEEEATWSYEWMLNTNEQLTGRRGWMDAVACWNQ